MNKKVVKVYTDGACRGNPGPGGWAAILLWNNTTKEIFGGEQDTTNNRMELKAAIEGLKAVKRPVKIEIYTDSEYLKNGMTVWIKSWLTNNWNKGKIKNIDLWQDLYNLSKQFEIEWHWIKSHNGNKYNELADKLARDAIKELSKTKYN